MELSPGLTEAAVTWMLEPLTITVKFTDDALYCPDVQVDLWTNLPEALMPSADTSLSQLEAAAASSSASVTIIADDEGSEWADPLVPLVRVQGASCDEWHAIRTTYDAKRKLFIAVCVPIRPGIFEYTARAVYPRHSQFPDTVWAGAFGANAAIHVQPPRLLSSLTSPVCLNFAAVAANLLLGASATASQLHVAWCGLRFSHWYRFVKSQLCDSQRVPAHPLPLFAIALLCCDLEAQVSAPRDVIRRLADLALKTDWFKTKSNVLKLFKRSMTLAVPSSCSPHSKLPPVAQLNTFQRCIDTLAAAAALPFEAFCPVQPSRRQASLSPPPLLIDTASSHSSTSVSTSPVHFSCSTPIVLSRNRYQLKYRSGSGPAPSPDGCYDCDNDALVHLFKLALFTHQPASAYSDTTLTDCSTTIFHILTQLVKVAPANALSSTFIQLIVQHLSSPALRRWDKPFVLQLLQLCYGFGMSPQSLGKALTVRKRVEVAVSSAILDHIDSIMHTLSTRIPNELDLPAWMTNDDGLTSGFDEQSTPLLNVAPTTTIPCVKLSELFVFCSQAVAANRVCTPAPQTSPPALFGSPNENSCVNTSVSDASDTDHSVSSTTAVTGRRPPKPPAKPSSTPSPSFLSTPSVFRGPSMALSSPSQLAVSPLVRCVAYGLVKLSPLVCSEYDSLLRCAGSMSACDLGVARAIADVLLKSWPRGDAAKEIKLLRFIGEHSKWAVMDAEKEALSAPSGRSTPLSRASMLSTGRFSDSGACRTPSARSLNFNNSGSDSDTGPAVPTTPLAERRFVSDTNSADMSPSFGPKPSFSQKSAASSIFEIDLLELDRDSDPELAAFQENTPSPRHDLKSPKSPLGSLEDDSGAVMMSRSKTFRSTPFVASSPRPPTPKLIPSTINTTTSPTVTFGSAPKPMTLLDRLMRRLSRCIRSSHVSVCRAAIDLFDVTAGSSYSQSHTLNDAQRFTVRLRRVSSSSACPTIKGCLERVVIVSPAHRDIIVSALEANADHHWTASVRSLSNLVASTISVRVQALSGNSADEDLTVPAPLLRSRSPLCSLSSAQSRIAMLSSPLPSHPRSLAVPLRS